MKNYLLVSLALLSSFATAQNQRGWVVGKDYVAFWEGTSEFKVERSIVPESWGFEAARCRLWVTDKNSHQLLSLLPGELTAILKTELQGRILSDSEGGQFFTYNSAVSQIERRGTDGAVLGSFALGDPALLSRVRSLGQVSWGLFLNPDENKIWLRQYDEKFQKTKELPVATAKVIWANPRFLISPESKELWVGYTASGPTAPYTPIIKKMTSEGKAVAEFTFKEKGIFFDFCFEGEKVLVARDIPTAPYTVPVHSFLEELSPGDLKKSVYSAATNYFIDSVGCTEDSVWMAQRSIFSSDGSYLVHWKKGDSSAGTIIQKLPASADQLYLCE